MMRKTRSIAARTVMLIGVAGTTLSGASASALTVGADYEIIALTGDAPPEGNGAFSTFVSPRISASGIVMFSAQLTGTIGGNSDNQGFYLHDSGLGLMKVVREGDASPDGDGTFLDTNAFMLHDVNSQDSLAIIWGLTGTDGGSADDAGVYRDSGAGLVTLARESDEVPGGNVFPVLLQPHAWRWRSCRVFRRDRHGR